MNLTHKLVENIFNDIYDIDQENNSSVEIADNINDYIIISDYNDAYEEFKNLYEFSDFKSYEMKTTELINSLFKTKQNFETFINDLINLYGQKLSSCQHWFDTVDEQDEYYDTVIYPKVANILIKKYNLKINQEDYNFLDVGGFIWCACEYGL